MKVHLTLESFMGNVKTNLENSILDKSCFEYDGDTYRLRGYYFVYTLANGDREFAAVSKENSNSVSGSGVSGVIAPLQDIKWIDEQTLSTEERIQQEIESSNRRIEESKFKYEFLKSLPVGITRDKYEEMIIDRLMDDLDKMDFFS